MQFPRNLIWNSCIPTKVSFFAWEAWWGKVLTMDRLKKRDIYLASRCPLCEREESLDHLLLHCTKTHELWTVVFAIFGVNWVVPSSIREPLLGWIGPFARKILKKVWMAAPLCLFWTIWRERNRVVFKDILPSAQRMKNSLVFALWS